jgi:hypothetical protein
MDMRCGEIGEKKYDQIRAELMTQEHLHELFEELEREKPSLDGQIETVSERKKNEPDQGPGRRKQDKLEALRPCARQEV